MPIANIYSVFRLLVIITSVFWCFSCVAVIIQTGADCLNLIHVFLSVFDISNQLSLWAHMSRVVRKPAYCISENKDADQLHGNCEADQRLCFRYADSTIPLLSKSEISSQYSSSVVVQPGLCRTWSQTPKTGFSHNEAHMIAKDHSLHADSKDSDQTGSAEEIRCIFDDN